MGIREKTVLLAVLIMAFTYLILVNWVSPKHPDPGIPAQHISEPFPKKTPPREDVFFPPTPKVPEEDIIVEETLKE